MIQLIENKTKQEDFKRYKKLTPKLYQQCLSFSRRLKGKKIIHISSTPEGGGVAELLKSQISLEKSLGLDSKWFYIKAPKRFFEITKEIHNRLQGRQGSLTEKEKDFYFKRNNLLTISLKKILEKQKPDIIIIHDPQPLPLVRFLYKKIPAVLRIHIDLSSPCAKTLEMLKEDILKYNLIILTDKKYKPNWLPKNKTFLSMPAINPFTEKNRPIAEGKTGQILEKYGIDINRPVVSQVSRFDPWKDQISTIKAYRTAKKKIPGLQLILVGFLETLDDPESLRMYQKIKKYSNNDPDIFIFADLKQIKESSDDPLINAVYANSNIVVQKSTREGFGIVVAEAMWKNKPVIGGKGTGIGLQIKNGKNGFLVSSTQEISDLIIKLIENKNLGEKIGASAHKTIKEKFLMPRLILDFLKIYKKIPRVSSGSKIG
ncbi:glycosyltransferase [Patescibacteria group bacterium]|nr:glycosyltransferase [Patescibacteria group bacterium]